MIELKKEFRKSGSRHFRQVYKDFSLVIYKVTQSHADDDGTLTYYEVFRPKIYKANDHHDEEFEKYPSDEDFGRWAWCCSNINCLKQALEKHFDEHPFSEFDARTLASIVA